MRFVPSQSAYTPPPRTERHAVTGATERLNKDVTVQQRVLVVLSTGRSFSTVLSAMLGLHPCILALPETCLFARETMQQYIDDLGFGLFEAGLVHAVSLLFFADQPDSRDAAREWIRDRRGETTRAVFEQLAHRSRREISIEKTPILTTKLAHMRRVETYFGDSVRYLHLVRHPHSFGLSLIETANAMLRRSRAEVADRWLGDEESIFSRLRVPETGELDPERPWVARNTCIETFLEEIPPHRWTRLRGEDLIANPAAALIHLCTWLGAPITPGVLQRMLRTETWEFASGRPGASGGDRKFFHDPRLRAAGTPAAAVSSPVPWATDGRPLTEAGAKLAQHYGYD